MLHGYSSYLGVCVRLSVIVKERSPRWKTGKLRAAEWGEKGQGIRSFLQISGELKAPAIILNILRNDIIFTEETKTLGNTYSVLARRGSGVDRSSQYLVKSKVMKSEIGQSGQPRCLCSTALGRYQLLISCVSDRMGFWWQSRALNGIAETRGLPCGPREWFVGYFYHLEKLKGNYSHYFEMIIFIRYLKKDLFMYLFGGGEREREHKQGQRPGEKQSP